jgi:ATP-binding cassette, subfamily B, bacterial PglK
MRETVERLASFVEPGRRLHWVGLALLALAVTGLEVVSAFLVFVLVQGIAEPTAPLELPLVGVVSDSLAVGSTDRLVGAMAVAAGFFLFRALVVLGQSYAQGRVAQTTGVRLSARLFRGYLRMPYPFHLSRTSSDLIRTVNDAVTDVVTSTLVPAVRLVSEALVIVGLSAVLVAASPLAAGLAVVLFVPLIFVLLRAVQPRIAALGQESHALGEETLQVLQQSLHGFRDIVILGRLSYFHGRYVATREAIARTRYIRQVLGDVPRVGLEAALMLFVALFIVVTVRVGGSPQQSLAVLGMFAYAALRILPSLNKAVLLVTDLKFGSAAARAIHEDLLLIEGTEDWARASGEHEDRVLPLRQEIRLDRVSYRYPSAHPLAIEDAELEIRAGESVGFVGATGAGKTTLVDVILGLLPPTAGRVLVDGVDIRSDLAAWHRNLGVVPQVTFLLDDTLRRNIALGYDDDEVDEDRVWEAVRLAQLEPFVRTLPTGLDTVAGERGVRVSGGQRQRVAIARALYRRPAVLVFDEGTSALDTITESALVQALEALRGKATMITVAHRLTTVQRCDRIVLVEGARITDVGTFAELLERNATFRRMAS